MVLLAGSPPVKRIHWRSGVSCGWKCENCPRLYVEDVVDGVVDARQHAPLACVEMVPDELHPRRRPVSRDARGCVDIDQPPAVGRDGVLPDRFAAVGQREQEFVFERLHVDKPDVVSVEVHHLAAGDVQHAAVIQHAAALLGTPRPPLVSRGRAARQLDRLAVTQVEPVQLHTPGRRPGPVVDQVLRVGGEAGNEVVERIAEVVARGQLHRRPAATRRLSPGEAVPKRHVDHMGGFFPCGGAAGLPRRPLQLVSANGRDARGQHGSQYGCNHKHSHGHGSFLEWGTCSRFSDGKWVRGAVEEDESGNKLPHSKRLCKRLVPWRRFFDQFVPPDFAVQRGPLDAEDGGRAALVPAGVPEGRRDVVAFHVGQRSG